MKLRKITLSQLDDNYRMGFELDKDKFIASLSQLDLLLKKEGLEPLKPPSSQNPIAVSDMNVTPSSEPTNNPANIKEKEE